MAQSQDHSEIIDLGEQFVSLHTEVLAADQALQQQAPLPRLDRIIRAYMQEQAITPDNKAEISDLQKCNWASTP